MANDIENGKACAALAYLFPIGLIWYLVDEKMKRNKFVAFHVYQSLAFAIVYFVAWVAMSIVGVIFAITIVLAPIAFLLWLVVSLAGLAWFLQGLINALSGKQNKLFLIGSIGDNFKF
jgi:uncharacterized membrane protein